MITIPLDFMTTTIRFDIESNVDKFHKNIHDYITPITNWTFFYCIKDIIITTK